MPRVRVRVNCGKGRPRTFRRAGIMFHPEAGEHEVTDGQLAAIEAEPMLIVEAAPEGDGQPESNDGEPVGRIEGICVAIVRLDKGDETHWTKGGKPEIKALEALLGYDITGRERDAAWEMYKASPIPGEG